MNKKMIKGCKWIKKKEFELLSRISPRHATEVLYKRTFGREINLEYPRYFSEKLHYLKLNNYYNNPLITACIDKYTVKSYMSCVGKGELCAKLYGVYDKPSEIEWEKLPNQFIVKCTHGCGYNIVCHNKQKFNVPTAEKKLMKWMKDDYWVKYAETQYRFVRKRIIVEEYLGDNLVTYRFCCFHGEPKIIYVQPDEEGKNYIDYFDVNWKKLDYRWAGWRSAPVPPSRPKMLCEMQKIARELSKGFPFVRIDLYETCDHIYFSEFTFVPAGGIMRFEKKRTARLLGSWIDI